VLVYRSQGRGESLCVSLDQGTAELRFAGKVAVQAGLGYVQLRGDIGITKPVEATQLHQPFRNIQDAGRCIVAEPGDLTSLPSGHDAWVIGNDPVVVVDWYGASNYAKVG
jgi:hypothetical protein